MQKPLDGFLVVDFSQFLAGPGASLRLADLGAKVIKVERPGSGDIARQLYMCNQRFNGESLLFHSVNRDKQSVALDLKDPNDLESARDLIRKADIVIQNFRPGVIERLGLGYEEVKKLNPRLVYASVSGYGDAREWRDLPGQDLLVQARSGITWLNGNAGDPPTPIGLSIIDMFAGAHLVQGILSALIRRGVTGVGGLVEVSLLESALDLQFELLSIHLNDGGKLPSRSVENNGNAYLAAPYGIYQTLDAHLALAMNSVPKLALLLDVPELARFESSDSWFECRDEIKLRIAESISKRTADDWVAHLEPHGIWCAKVIDWRELFDSSVPDDLGLLQEITAANGDCFRTTRCPIRIDGEIFKGAFPAPSVGQHNAEVLGMERP